MMASILQVRAPDAVKLHRWGEIIAAFSVEVNRICIGQIHGSKFSVAEHGASEDAIQRQSSSGPASPSAAASTDDGAAAGPDSDRFSRVQESVDSIADQNMPDMRPGMLCN